MLDALFSSSLVESLSFKGLIIVILSALTLGLCISLVYRKIHKNEEYSASFTVTLIMLPAIISMIILLVGNNVARAFSLAGAFSLIRFRSAPEDPKDIAYVFFTLGVGLACGMGYIGYATLFAAILCGAMALLWKMDYGKNKNKWIGYDYYGDDRTLDTHIKLLRQALGGYSKLVATLRNIGYRFEG